MYCFRRLILLLAVFVLFGARLPAFSAPSASPAAPQAVSGRVVNDAGVPVAGATIAAEMLDYRTDKATIAGTTQSGANGSFHLNLPAPSPSEHAIFYVTSPGEVGVARCDPIPAAQAKPVLVTIEPVTSIHLRFVDESGQPAANIPVHVMALARGQDWVAWFVSPLAPWNGVTNGAGMATFDGLPQGYSIYLVTDDDRFTRQPEEVDLANANTSPEQTVHVTHGGAVSGTVTYGTTHQPAAGVLISVDRIGGPVGEGFGTTDAQGRYRVSHLGPGDYYLVLVNDDRLVRDWTAAAQKATVKVGSEQSGIDFVLVHGAAVSGLVTDKRTGKPLPGVMISVQGPDHPQGSQQAVTGPDGRYALHVVPGDQTISAFSPGVVSYAINEQAKKLAAGDTWVVNFQVDAPRLPRPVSGVVVGPGNKPVAGAQVLALDFQTIDRTNTDSQGRFSFDQPGLYPGAMIFARQGALATRLPVDIGTRTGPTLHLAPGALSTLSGKVFSDSGRPVPYAKVTLFILREGIGSQFDTTSTDSKGRYRFQSVFGGGQYQVMAEAGGFAENFANGDLRVTSGQSARVNPITLQRADSFLGGTVVDPSGKPEAGAQVIVNNVDNLRAVTDQNGRFRLFGVPRNQVELEVRAPDNRDASIMESGGQSGVVIKVTSYSEIEAASRAFAAVVRADATNHGNGENANMLLRSAENQARASGKKVFLVFHASWCGPCFMLHHFLNDPQVKPVIDSHFVVQEIDIWERGNNGWENPGGTAIYKRYGGPNSVPFYVVLDPSGKKLGDSIFRGDNMGMPTQPDEIAYFLGTLKRADPSLTDSEMAVLKEGLARTAALGT